MKEEKLNNRNENMEEDNQNQAKKLKANMNIKENQAQQMQEQPSMCPYFMSQSCPMTGNLGTQYQGLDNMNPNMGDMYGIGQNMPNQGDMYGMGQTMPNWWGGSSPYDFGNGLAQYTSPNNVSDVWSQNQGNCTQNCTQDMYIQGGMPQPTYMPNWTGDMGMQSPSMMQNMPWSMQTKPNMMQCPKRPMCSGSSYGSCYSPYGLGRY